MQPQAHVHAEVERKAIPERYAQAVAHLGAEKRPREPPVPLRVRHHDGHSVGGVRVRHVARLEPPSPHSLRGRVVRWHDVVAASRCAPQNTSVDKARRACCSTAPRTCSSVHAEGKVVPLDDIRRKVVLPYGALCSARKRDQREHGRPHSGQDRNQSLDDLHAHARPSQRSAETRVHNITPDQHLVIMEARQRRNKDAMKRTRARGRTRPSRVSPDSHSTRRSRWMEGGCRLAAAAAANSLDVQRTTITAALEVRD